MPERKQFNAKEVFERADEGDSLAQSVIDEVSAKLHLWMWLMTASLWHTCCFYALRRPITWQCSQSILVEWLTQRLLYLLVAWPMLEIVFYPEWSTTFIAGRGLYCHHLFGFPSLRVVRMRVCVEQLSLHSKWFNNLARVANKLLRSSIVQHK